MGFVLVSRLALPNQDDFPAQFLEFYSILSIALHVLRKLGVPELNSTLRCVGKPASFVAVPVATVYEDHRLVFWENDVRPARQAPVPRTIHGEAIA